MKRVNGVNLEKVLDQISVGDAVASARFNRRKLLAAFLQIGLVPDDISGPPLSASHPDCRLLPLGTSSS